jgi:hypothetical protein
MLHICPALYFYMEKQYLAFEHALCLLHVLMLVMAYSRVYLVCCAFEVKDATMRDCSGRWFCSRMRCFRLHVVMIRCKKLLYFTLL